MVLGGPWLISTTVELVHFRHSAVCQPFVYRSNQLSQVNCRVFKYLFFITVLSVAVNVPRFFEVVFVNVPLEVEDGENSTNQTKLGYELSDLRKNPDYIRCGSISSLFIH